MDIMLPSFVTDRIVEMTHKENMALPTDVSSSAFSGSVSRTSADEMGLDVDFGTLSVTWEFPAVAVMFASFSGGGDGEAATHGAIDAAMQDIERVVQRHRVLKVKTMGAAIMCVAGIDDTRTREEAVLAVVEAARDARREVLAPMAERDAQLRYSVGVSCGPCFGAVIGGHGCIFDIFGDTVNTASRMMSTAAGGAIQLSAAARGTLPADSRLVGFSVGSLPAVHVKGKGTLDVFSIDDGL